MLGSSDTSSMKPDGSSLLIAQILDAADHRGLWIELNSKREKWPEQPEFNLSL